MTAAAARDFLELLEADNTLQTQLLVYDPEDFDDLVDFAVSKGYLFSKDDLLDVLEDYPEGPLSEHMRVLTR
ncbi:MAG: Nif11-like leader peptide family natural product precursor [Anaerolineae bacterium]|nr:Nif11-like leader peptide family natural product precursor [Anaerolineae bacterium]